VEVDDTGIAWASDDALNADWIEPQSNPAGDCLLGL
jgi:hypothetical protein